MKVGFRATTKLFEQRHDGWVVVLLVAVAVAIEEKKKVGGQWWMGQ